jgi:hypothetical protein
MLSELEEQLLRTDLKNRTPMSPVNPGAVDNQMTLGQHIQRLMAKVFPMPIVAGQPEPATDNRTIRPVAAEEPELLARTKKFRRPKETMMQFHARTGLGAAQIRGMSQREIENFLAVVEQNDERAAVPAIFEPKPRPSKFYLEV